MASLPLIFYGAMMRRDWVARKLAGVCPPTANAKRMKTRLASPWALP